MKNFISGLILLILSGVFLINTLTVAIPEGLPLSPMLYPQIVLSVMALCGFLLVATSVPTLRAELGSWRPPGSLQWVNFKGAARSLLPFVLLFAYVCLIIVTGYFLPTLLFGVLLMLALGERRLSLLVPVPLAFTALIWLVFIKVSVIPLPAGQGPFRVLNQWLMFG